MKERDTYKLFLMTLLKLLHLYPNDDILCMYSVVRACVV